MEILKSKLIGEQLSSVEFVQDYLQLHFDGRTITVYIWPTIQNSKEIFYFGDEGYRNRLCDLITFTIKDLSYKKDDFMILFFNDTTCRLRINLNPSNHEIVSEIANFNDETDNTWIVFE